MPKRPLNRISRAALDHAGMTVRGNQGCVEIIEARAAIGVHVRCGHDATPKLSSAALRDRNDSRRAVIAR